MLLLKQMYTPARNEAKQKREKRAQQKQGHVMSSLTVCLKANTLICLLGFETKPFNTWQGHKISNISKDVRNSFKVSQGCLLRTGHQITASVRENCTFRCTTKKSTIMNRSRERALFILVAIGQECQDKP